MPLAFPNTPIAQTDQDMQVVVANMYASLVASLRAGGSDPATAAATAALFQGDLRAVVGDLSNEAVLAQAHSLHGDAAVFAAAQQAAGMLPGGGLATQAQMTALGIEVPGLGTVTVDMMTDADAQAFKRVKTGHTLAAAARANAIRRSPLPPGSAVPKTKNNRRMCSAEGCHKYARTGGVCVAHGANVTRKICVVEGCIKFARRGGVCIAHGAKTARSTRRAGGRDVSLAQQNAAAAVAAATAQAAIAHASNAAGVLGGPAGIGDNAGKQAGEESSDESDSSSNTSSETKSDDSSSDDERSDPTRVAIAKSAAAAVAAAAANAAGIVFAADEAAATAATGTGVGVGVGTDGAAPAAEGVDAVAVAVVAVGGVAHPSDVGGGVVVPTAPAAPVPPAPSPSPPAPAPPPPVASSRLRHMRGRRGGAKAPLPF